MRTRNGQLLRQASLLVAVLSCKEGSPDRSNHQPDSHATQPVVIDNVPESVLFARDTLGWANKRLRVTQHALMRFWDSSGRFPDSLLEAVPPPPGLKAHESYQYDPWGSAIRYSHTDSSFQIRSAGPDRLVGTNDDLLIKATINDSRVRKTP